MRSLCFTGYYRIGRKKAGDDRGSIDASIPSLNLPDGGKHGK
jgi:hypothetical protein